MLLEQAQVRWHERRLSREHGLQGVELLLPQPVATRKVQQLLGLRRRHVVIRPRHLDQQFYELRSVLSLRDARRAGSFAHYLRLADSGALVYGTSVTAPAKIGVLFIHSS